MTTLTITIPDEVKSKLSQFVKEIGGEILVDETSKKKAKHLNEIKIGIQQVKAIQAGKLKAFSMNDLLNDK